MTNTYFITIDPLTDIIYYSGSDPQQFIGIDNHHMWSVNVRRTRLGPHLIGFYFREEYLNIKMLLAFLINQFSLLLEVPLEIRTPMFFQMDGTSSHLHQ